MLQSPSEVRIKLIDKAIDLIKVINQILCSLSFVTIRIERVGTLASADGIVILRVGHHWERILAIVLPLAAVVNRHGLHFVVVSHRTIRGLVGSFVTATSVVVDERLRCSSINTHSLVGQFPTAHQTIITHISNIGIGVLITQRIHTVICLIFSVVGQATKIDTRLTGLHLHLVQTDTHKWFFIDSRTVAIASVIIAILT